MLTVWVVAVCVFGVVVVEGEGGLGSASVAATTFLFFDLTDTNIRA